MAFPALFAGGWPLLLLLSSLALTACGGRQGQLTEAPALDDAEAQRLYRLGLAYYSGEGLPRDVPLAAAHFERAARAGHPEAQYLAGRAFSNGEGVERDPAWAARWYGKAARRGEPRAQFALGIAYGLGLGLPKDPVQSYRWLLTAERAGVAGAGALAEALARVLQPTAEQAARRAAETFRPSAGDGLHDQPTVLYVQQRLADSGFDPGPIDGYLGPRTRRAILAFQRASGESPDGGLSESLLASLRAGASV